MYAVKKGRESVFKNIVMPVLSVIACIFMVFAAIYAHGITPYLEAAKNGEFAFPVLFYLIVFAAVMTAGAVFYNRSDNKKAI